MSTREKLFLGFLMVVTIVAAVGYVSIRKSQEELQKSIGEASTVLASEILEHIDINIHRRIKAIEGHSRSFIAQQTVSESNKEFEELDNIQGYIAEKDREWTSAPQEEITPFMLELSGNKLSRELKETVDFYKESHHYKVFNDVFITNKYGVNIAQTSKTSDYYQGDEQWWQETKKDGLYVEDVEYDESSDVYSTGICVRIDDQGGNFSGVIKAVLNIEDTIDLIRNNEHTTAEYKLLTKDHKIIYSTEDFEFFQDLPVELTSRLQKGEGPEGSLYFIAKGDTSGKKEELFAHAYSRGHGEYKGLGWILLVEHDTGEILVSSTRLRGVLLIILLVFIVSAVFVGLFISHSIHAPLKKLKNAMTEVGKGKLDTRVEIESKDEIGFLANSFNKMTEDLKITTTSVDKLNKEVCERKRAEVNLRTAKEQAELLYRVVPSAIFTVDKENYITSWNNKATEITGYTADEVLGTKCKKFALMPCIKKCSLYSDDVEKPIVSKECTIKRKDGKTAAILKNVDLLKDEDGNIIGGIESFEDVTSRKKAEMVKEKLLHDIGKRIKEIRCLHELSELVDKSDLSLKKAFQEAVNLIPQGWQYPEITCAKIVFKDSEYKTDNYETSRWKQSVDIKVQGKKVGSLEVYYLQEKPPADEGPFLKEERDLINALAERLGKTAERKVIEDHLDQHRHNLETLVDERTSELKETQSQLVQNDKLASIGQLAAGVAHEMNTPVGFVTSNFQTLEDYVKKIGELVAMYNELIEQFETSDKSKLRNKVDSICQTRDDMQIDYILEDINGLFDESREGLDRITDIIQNLRDFSRIDQPGSRGRYNINKGIDSTLVVARNEIKYDADIKTDFSDVPLIFCHSGQINQVFLNILLNAAQAIKAQERDGNGTITIKTYTTDDNEVICEITDDGPGIPSETLSKIFDPFFTTKPVGKGTGLGLSVSYDIITNKHNGKLLVDSTVGEGTKFTIKLPIDTKENEEKEIAKNGKENSVICG